MKSLIIAVSCVFSLSAFSQMPTSDQLKAGVDAAKTQTQQATEQGKDKTAGMVQKAKEKALVNLNTASADDLAKLPGIGPARAKAIVEGRPYTSLEDLKKVKGIKEGVIAKIKGLVTL